MLYFLLLTEYADESGHIKEDKTWQRVIRGMKVQIVTQREPKRKLEQILHYFSTLHNALHTQLPALHHAWAFMRISRAKNMTASGTYSISHYHEVGPEVVLLFRLTLSR